MGKFGGNNNNNRVQRGGGRGPRPQGGFKRDRQDGGDVARRGGFRRGGAGNQQGGDEGRRGGSFRRGSGSPRRGGPRGEGGRGGKPRDHSALDEDMLQYWDKAGVKDKRDEEKALQKAKLDRELEEYTKQATAAADTGASE